jgi:hypothetical protein
MSETVHCHDCAKQIDKASCKFEWMVRGEIWYYCSLVCNACQTTAGNLGFGPEFEAEEPLWDMLAGNRSKRCKGKVALAIAAGSGSPPS